MAGIQLSREGLSLRFGQPDTAVPQGAIPSGIPPRIVVAVAPSDPRIRVYARFRVNGGPEQSVSLRPERRSREELFFEGGIPGLHRGETIEYWIYAVLESQGAVVRLDSSQIAGGTRQFEMQSSALRRLDAVRTTDMRASLGPGVSAPERSRAAEDAERTSDASAAAAVARASLLENKVVFPLKQGMKGPEVADLQDGLRLLLERRFIEMGDAERGDLLSVLAKERADTVYGDITAKVVSIFQEQRGLDATGEVNEKTAGLLNDILEGLGAFDEQPAQPQMYVVAGQVRDDAGNPFSALQVRAFHADDRAAIRLGSDKTDASGRYTIRYNPLPDGLPINLYVTVADADEQTLGTSDVVRGAEPTAIINLAVPVAQPAAAKRSIVGRVVLDDGRPAEGVTLRIYRRSFGGRVTQLDSTTTLAGGRYSLSFGLDPAGASLQIVAVRPMGEEVPLAAQLSYLGDEPRVTRNLVAPRDLIPRVAEFRRLAADLRPHIGEITALAEAKETSGRQDLTALNRATGWDARLLALGALAMRLSADPQTPTSPEAFYGLLRAGLPSDKVLLAQITPDVAEKALTIVRNTGIVQMSDNEIAAFKSDFRTFSTAVRLSMPVPGGNASYGDMLAATGLPKEKQDAFADVFLEYGKIPSQLWTKAREKGLTEAEIGRLQLQGKLAFLTGGSREMTGRLMAKKVSATGAAAGPPLSDSAQLVDLGLYTAQQWGTELDAAAVAAGQSVDALIPSAYVGSPAQRRHTYTEDMARKVRISYPMQVLAHEIRTDSTDGFVLGTAAGPTAKLLRGAAGQGFRLGTTPVDAFFNAYPGAGEGMSESEWKSAKAGLKDLYRTYQISPNDDVMKMMRQHGLCAAQDVTGMSKKHFLEFYGSLFPTPQQAELVHRKAEQVSSMVYNLFTIANQVESQVVVYGASAPADVQQSVKNELIRHYPTLETLFGSMDFCECEHCRSVLSPAAYLVDLLQYVEGEDAARAGFDNTWKERHGGKGYAESEAMPGMNYALPYDALIERRPDLIHIPLTCENTHTALPYIDIVNEILEYYVAHGALDEAAAHDTGEATTAELLAEPQNVIRDAYKAVRAARYPLTLPFDLWLETVRQFCQFFEAPLADVLEVFRPGDELFVPAQPYDRAAIFIESLGLSPTEAALFTDPDPLAGGKWYELFGYATTGPLIADPTNAAPDATLTLPNADATFDVSNPVTYYRTAGGVQGETRTIKAIGDPDSGGTGRRLVTLNGLWTAPPAAGDQLIPAAPALLRSAKTLSRRLGVTFKQVVELVQTGFVNPELVELTLLYKLGATVADVFFYRDHRVFYEANDDLRGKVREDLPPADQARYDALADRDPATGLRGWDIVDRVGTLMDRLTAASAEFSTPTTPFDALAWVNTALVANRFNDVLVLADPNAGCNFDATMLRYADGRAADDLVFLRLNLFVRLWRKLGWTIEETDRALTTFTRPIPYGVSNLAQRPLRAALIYMAHLKKLVEWVRVGKDARRKLLTLWADIPTTGKRPLYAQLFLTRSVLKSDPLFDHPLGEYLADERIFLKDHVPALQGALGLTADEINRILTDAGLDPATAKLTLPNVSVLYRYGLLAKGLKLSVSELIALKTLSGLNPFASLSAAPPATLAEDHPFSQTLAFVDVAQAVRDSGLTVEDLDYMLRHRFDPTGKYRADAPAEFALLKTLAEGIRAIQAEHVAPAAPDTLSDEALGQKLGLALSPDVAQTLLAMLNGTAEFTAIVSGVAAGDALAPATFADAPDIVEVSYNATRQEQKLTYRGVLLAPQQAELENQLADALSDTQETTFAALLTNARGQARAFFGKHLQKQAPGMTPAYGFLDAADFDLLFDPAFDLALDPATPPEKVEQERARRRRARLAEAFLPFLKARLIRQFILQTLTAQTGADAVLVESMVTDARLLGLPLGGRVRPLLEALTATAERGLSVTFFAAADGADPPLGPPVTRATADTGSLPPGANSARLEGYLEAPESGAYRFFVRLDKQNAAATLRFAHLTEPTLTGTAAADGDEVGDGPAEFAELKAGISYCFTLDLHNLNGGGARLLVQSETLPKDSLSRLALYPSAALAGADRSLTLLTKALQLAQALGLSEREARFLLTNAADFGGVNLSELPTAVTGDTPGERAAAVQCFGGFRRLAAYARLRQDLAAGTDDLITLFEAQAAGGAAAVYPHVARLARRDEATVQETAELLWPDPAGPAPAFTSEEPLLRLWAALQIVERFGVPVASIQQWTGIVGAASSDEARFAIARDLREVIKARFEPDEWQGVAKLIFDRLRQRQRDALVAHVLHTRGLDRLEQLYEFFLIDPGMEPVVQTSRIRLAIASVQLFIQRCLLNLEAKVHPSAILNAEHWEWMKRYRVWEANRKIFLFPENWLEPEFRDDKTHLFAELEGTLLQGDVSRDLAEDAFLNYLRKLDELARLDIVAMHLEQRDDPGQNVLHVFGRTYSEPHKYFYRRFAAGMWTPWEPMSVEIQGDHLAPVIWRDRLYLFWVTFVEKVSPSSYATSVDPSKANALPTLTNWVEAQLHWSEYLNGEWTTHESGAFDGAGVITFTNKTLSQVSDLIVHVSKKYSPEAEELGVNIHLGSEAKQAFYLAGRNSSPALDTGKPAPTNPYSSASTKRANRYEGSGVLQVKFTQRITTEIGESRKEENSTQPILGTSSGLYTLLPLNSGLGFGVPKEAYVGADKDQEVRAALESSLAETESLIKPVFFQDDSHTFFVEPEMVERTVEQVETWLEPPEPPGPGLSPDPDWWEWLEEYVGKYEPERGPIGPWPPEDPWGGRSKLDWVTNPATVVLIDSQAIGPLGGVPLTFEQAAPEMMVSGATVHVNSAGAIGANEVAVLGQGLALEEVGLTKTAVGLSVVGARGINAGLMQNVKQFASEKVGVGLAGVVMGF